MTVVEDTAKNSISIEFLKKSIDEQKEAHQGIKMQMKEFEKNVEDNIEKGFNNVMKEIKSLKDDYVKTKAKVDIMYKVGFWMVVMISATILVGVFRGDVDISTLVSIVKKIAQ